MKILLLGDIHSTHLQKWIKSLASRGISLYVFTLSREKKDPEFYKGITVYHGWFSNSFDNLGREGSASKLFFLLRLPSLKKIIKKIKPDIIHAHYGSSYGFIGALTGFHPYYVSYWGSDIFSYPKKSSLHKFLTRFTLNKADRIFSTSRMMASEINNYTGKNICVIPFGVDTQLFRKNEKTAKNSKEIVIGIVKSLESIYGTDILLDVFCRLKKLNPSKNLKLNLTGSGSLETELKRRVKELEIENDVIFRGYIPLELLPDVYSSMDIFANLSRHESFGVSVLEAGSCELPVVASSKGGLNEVMVDNETGFLVNLDDEESIIEKFQLLLDDSQLRIEMGKKGRRFVIENYSWEESVNKMISAYFEPDQQK
jgi:L-malate glycosyltransferase